jgi:multidrug resistance efflux pump
VNRLIGLLPLALAGTLALAGCGSLTEVGLAPSSGTSVQSSRKPEYTVRRGSIAETVTVPGRVASQDEVSLFFRDGGRVGRVTAEVTRKVQKGAVLAELETGPLESQIAQAKLDREIATIRLGRARGRSGAASERAALLTAAAEVSRAEVAYQAAVAEIDTMNGDRVVEAQAARSAVDSARAGLRSSQASLAELQAGPSPDQRRTAEQAVAAARAGLDEREAALAKARAGAAPDQLRQAELGLAEAKAILLATQNERDSIRADPRASEQSRRAGDARVIAAESAAAQALTHLQALKAGPDANDVAAAEAAVRRAQAELAAAEARLAELSAGANQDRVAGARGAMEAAEADYRAAAARLSRLDDPSQRSQPAAAQQRLLWASSWLEAARANYELQAARGDSSDGDVLLEQKGLERAQLILDQLERQAENARIRAPFDGMVSAISVRQGDTVQAYAPVVVVANPFSLDVAARLNPNDIAKIALGQEASVTLKTAASPTMTGRVAALPAPTQALFTTAGRSVRIRLDALPSDTEIGTPVEVAITVARRDDALLAPTGAIMRHSGRQYVQVIGDGGQRREVNVQIGIATGAETEVVKGLSEGQRVLGQ